MTVRKRLFWSNILMILVPVLVTALVGLCCMGDYATVAVHINRLREKIEENPAKPRYIETVWGAGYRFRG